MRVFSEALLLEREHSRNFFALLQQHRYERILAPKLIPFGELAQGHQGGPSTGCSKDWQKTVTLPLDQRGRGRTMLREQRSAVTVERSNGHSSTASSSSSPSSAATDRCRHTLAVSSMDGSRLAGTFDRGQLSLAAPGRCRMSRPASPLAKGSKGLSRVASGVLRAKMWARAPPYLNTQQVEHYHHFLGHNRTVPWRAHMLSFTKTARSIRLPARHFRWHPPDRPPDKHLQRWLLVIHELFMAAGAVGRLQRRGRVARPHTLETPNITTFELVVVRLHLVCAKRRCERTNQMFATTPGSRIRGFEGEHDHTT